jgi:hypothetical protein
VIRFQRISAATLLALALVTPRAVFADSSSIEQIVAKNLTPDVGGTVTFQIAVSPDDNLVWAPGSYSVTLTASDPGGNVVAAR